MGKLSCDAPLTSVPDAGQTKYCSCQCVLSCPAGQEQSSAGCECIDADPCAGQTCDAKADPSRWMMNASCACDAVYEGAFKQADGSDCPAGGEEGMEGEAGAIAQTAGLALAFAAALLF